MLLHSLAKLFQGRKVLLGRWYAELNKCSFCLLVTSVLVIIAPHVVHSTSKPTKTELEKSHCSGIHSFTRWNALDRSHRISIPWRTSKTLVQLVQPTGGTLGPCARYVPCGNVREAVGIEWIGWRKYHKGSQSDESAKLWARSDGTSFATDN